MEPTGVEPVSASSSNTPFVHRLSLSNPQGGNRQLSLAVGFSSKVLAKSATREALLEHPLGFVHDP
jgi:hypothetical protein